jgi:predicted dinucleotide-binding enzyme
LRTFFAPVARLRRKACGSSVNIGILGSGEVAKSLASGFLGRGDVVMLGSREPEKLAEWAAAGGANARTGTFAQTAQFGEIVLFATSGTTIEDVAALAEPENLATKTVIDVTNPLDFSTGKPRLAWGFDDSNGERLQQLLPSSAVVKAFNTVGQELFVHPDLPGGPPTMFIAGDDPAAKQRVSQILTDFGWESADIGDIESSRFLEPMCLAWVMYGRTTGDWSGHAFKLLHRPPPPAAS